MHCDGEVTLSCARCGQQATLSLAALPFRHAGTWEPSLVVVERFVTHAVLCCGDEARVELEASDGLGGPDLRVWVDGRPTAAAGLRLWFAPGGVPLEET